MSEPMTTTPTPDDTEATPALDVFLADFAENDNAWWYLSGGDMLNLFEDLLDRYTAAQAEGDALRARVEALLDRWAAAIRHPASDPGYSGGAVLHDIRAAVTKADR